MSGTEQVPGGLPSLLQKVRRRLQDHFLSRGFGSVLFYYIQVFEASWKIEVNIPPEAVPRSACQNFTPLCELPPKSPP